MTSLQTMPGTGCTPSPHRPRSPAGFPGRGLAWILAAGAILAAAGCSHLTPLGPDAAPALPPPRQLASPMVVQLMRGNSFAPAVGGQSPGPGGCPAGAQAVVVPPGAPSTGCFRPVGVSITITSAGLSPVITYPATKAAPGHPASPTSYAIAVRFPAADMAPVTSLIARAYNAGDALGVTVDGKLWQAPMVAGPFPASGFQISLLSKTQAVLLRRLLLGSG